MLHIVLNRCTWFFSDSVLYQTASFRRGFAFINKMFRVSNQSLLSEKSIPLPTLLLPPCCLSTMSQVIQPPGLAQKRNDWKHRVYNVLLARSLPLPQEVYHTIGHIGNSTQITVSGNRVFGSLLVAPDNCSNCDRLNHINIICVLGLQESTMIELSWFTHFSFILPLAHLF